VEVDASGKKGRGVNQKPQRQMDKVSGWKGKDKGKTGPSSLVKGMRVSGTRGAKKFKKRQ